MAEKSVPPPSGSNDSIPTIQRRAHKFFAARKLPVSASVDQLSTKPPEATPVVDIRKSSSSNSLSTVRNKKNGRRAAALRVKGPIRVFSCYYCPFETLSKKMLERHKYGHTRPAAKYRCKYCSFGCQIGAYLDRHVADHFKPIVEQTITGRALHLASQNIHEPKTVKSLAETIVCNYCGAQFEDKAALTEHSNSHNIFAGCNSAEKQMETNQNAPRLESRTPPETDTISDQAEERSIGTKSPEENIISTGQHDRCYSREELLMLAENCNNLETNDTVRQFFSENFENASNEADSEKMKIQTDEEEKGI